MYVCNDCRMAIHADFHANLFQLWLYKQTLYIAYDRETQTTNIN